MNIFIHGNYGYGNLADDIILETFIQDMDKKIKDNTNFVVSCINSKNVILSSHLYKKLKLIDMQEGLFPVKNISEIGKCNFFVLAGAPHLNGPEPVVIELSRIFTALFLGKGVFIWGIEFGPIRNNILRFFAKRILSKVNLIIVRDKNSYKRLIELGVKCPVLRAIDPVLHWRPKKTQYKELLKKYKIDINKPIISVFPRINANWPKYYNFISNVSILKSKLEAESERSEKLAEAIDALIENTDGKVLFIAEEFFENKTISDINKFNQIISFSKYKDKIIVINKILSPEQFKYLIKRATIIVSERLHPVVMSRDSYTPVVGVGGVYKKVEEVMKDIGQGKRILDFQNNDFQKNKKILLEIYKNKKKIKAELKADFRRILELSNKNNRVIEEMAKAKPKKPRKNYIKKFFLYIMFIFIGIIVYLVRLTAFIKVKFFKREKLLYLKNLP